MIDRGRVVTSGDREGASVDPDAPWRPTGRTLLADRGSRTAARPGRRRRATAIQLGECSDDDAPSSPWSRESVEAPLPTIDQIRRRWRRELGLDDSAAAPRPTELEPGAAPGPTRVRRPQAVDVPRSTVSGDLVLIGLVVTIVVVGSLAVAWALVPSPGVPLVATSMLPSAANRMWDVDVDESAIVAIGGGMVVAATPDALRTFDADDGTAVWSRSFVHGGDPSAVEVYDDVVVTVEETTRTVVTVSGFDVGDGTMRWSRRAPFATIALLPGTPIERSRPASTPQIQPLDPATGAAVGRPVDAVALPSPDHHVLGRRDGSLQLFDLRAGRWLGTRVDEFALRTIASVGEHVVGLTESSDIVIYDRHGAPLDQRTFVSNAFGDFEGRAELVGGIPGSSIGIVASGSSIGFDTSRGSIDVVWETPGRVGTPVETLVGPLAVARVADARTGEVDHALVDVTDGDTLVVTDVGVTREAPPIVAADGYIVAPTVGDATRTISAHDFQGGERWALPLEPGAEYRLVDGTLFVIEIGTISAHR